MRFLFVLFCLLSIWVKPFGQSGDIAKFPLPVIPPSPNASELGRYGNIPVSLFTGAVNQSVPIENIQIGNHPLSISISYNSTGIRVSQEASHIGLGWTLNAGGVITRSVLGLPDEEYYLTPNAKEVPVGELEPKDDFPYFLGLAENVSYDSQPDMFYFNFEGGSGRFFFDQDKKPHLSKHDNLKINWITTNRFEIITENGYKYIFEDVEMSSNDNKIGTVYYFPSAWYLSGIELPNGTEIVSFTYDTYSTFSKQYQSKTFTESFSMYSPYGAGYWCSSDLPEDNGGIYTTSIEAKILKKVEFRTGKVEFFHSGRLDHLAERKIDKIVVSNLKGIIREHAFQYSYFNDSAIVLETDFKRLKLEKLISKDKNLNTVSQYEFLYEELEALPQKTSFAQDHWGYYNGKNNNPHLVPTYKYTYTDHTGAWPMEKPGADRSSDGDYMKSGVLNQIKYPTGGYTNFTYEANDIGGGTQMVYSEYSVTKSVITDIQNNIFTRELTFAINKDATNAIITANFPSAEYLDQNGIKCHPTFSFLNVTQANAVINIDNFSFTQETFMGSVTLESNNTYKIIVNETDSRCYNSATYTPYLESELRVVFMDVDTTIPPVQVDIPKEKVGGLRIKKIENYNNSNGLTEIRSFDYSDGYNLSSGKLMERPLYEYTYGFRVNNPTDPNDSNPDCPVYTCNFLIRKASSFIDLGTVQGSHICYTKVSESFGTEGENGKIEYEYSFVTDPGGGGNAPGEFPFPPATSYDFYRGNLIKQTTYNKDNEIVRVITNQFNTKIIDTITALRVAKREGGINYQICLDPTQFVDPVPFNDHFINANYYLFSGLSRIQETSDVKYLPAGNLETITRYDYFHDNTIPSSIEAEQSDGERTTVYNTFYYDYDTGTSFVDYMSDKHILFPIEKVEVIKIGMNNFITAASLSKYEVGLPSEVYKAAITNPVPLSSWKFSNRSLGQLPTNNTFGTFNPDASYSKKYSLTDYDRYNNLLEQQKSDDIRQSYMWGYDSTYPVASVVNAAAKDIFHTSFEDGDGNSSDGDAKTGKKSKTDGFTKSLTGLTSGTYILSYWQKSGSNWNYHESTITVTGSAYTINLANQIDEVRFYPKKAQMTTYTYDPLMGMTSQTDINNQTAYYEYDDFGRLKYVLDKDRNVIKVIGYQYQQNINQ
ncbi:MAG: hypothetical protein KIT80_00100 [Chitinophagaceae bacterium]|nr:hypothetical protein [Chitinophagaceae bacterium]MCW5925291.1 hypothetical protein [Chitinophagaceae bacterium]